MGTLATEIFDGDDFFEDDGGGDALRIEFVDLVLDMDGNEIGVTLTGIFLDQSADADIDALHITAFSDVGGLATGVTDLFIESMIISVKNDLKDSNGDVRFNDADLFEIRFAPDGTATVVSTPIYTALNDVGNEVPIDAYTQTDVLDLLDILADETDFSFAGGDSVADYVLLTDVDGAGGDLVSVQIDPDGGGDSFEPPLGFISGFQLGDIVTAVVGPDNGETDFLTVM